MKAVVQRVSSAKVEVEEKIAGEIDRGFLVLLGVENGDTGDMCEYLAKKVSGLRIFEDENRNIQSRYEGQSFKRRTGDYYS